jgi:hypothetical protein
MERGSRRPESPWGTGAVRRDPYIGVSTVILSQRRALTEASGGRRCSHVIKSERRQPGRARRRQRFAAPRSPAASHVAPAAVRTRSHVGTVLMAISAISRHPDRRSRWLRAPDRPRTLARRRRSPLAATLRHHASLRSLLGSRRLVWRASVALRARWRAI